MAEMTTKMMFAFVILAVAVCLIPSGALASDISACHSVCSSTYQGTDDEGICKRGCRLMSVVDFFNEELSLKDTSAACLQACSEAYGMVNRSACAFGCQSQLPSVEDGRKQLAMVAESSQRNNMMSMIPSRVNDYYGRMMDCMMEHVQHQMTVGWMVFSSASISSDGRRFVVMRSSPVLVFRQAPDNSPEYKTSSFLEANLLADDHGATPDVKRSQLLPMVDSDDIDDSGPQFPGHSSDWLSCLSAKTGLSKLAIVVVMFSTLIVLMWFISGVLFPSTRTGSGVEWNAVNQKLSIYGDHEYLTIMDEMKYQPTGYIVDSTNFVNYAPPLPLKMQEI